MTAKEKAEHLIKEFMPYQDDYYNDEPRDGAISCALIAVDECIESTKQLINHYTKGSDERYASIYLSMSLSVQYWQEVKNELDKL
jgi:hypothetical protein